MEIQCLVKKSTNIQPFMSRNRLLYVFDAKIVVQEIHEQFLLCLKRFKVAALGVRFIVEQKMQDHNNEKVSHTQQPQRGAELPLPSPIQM